jgi:hypothetical protein
MTSNFKRLSLRKLEALNATCFPGSDRNLQLAPLIERKRRQHDRVWAMLTPIIVAIALKTLESKLLASVVADMLHDTVVIVLKSLESKLHLP